MPPINSLATLSITNLRKSIMSHYFYLYLGLGLNQNMANHIYQNFAFTIFHCKFDNLVENISCAKRPGKYINRAYIDRGIAFWGSGIISDSKLSTIFREHVSANDKKRKKHFKKSYFQPEPNFIYNNCGFWCEKLCK